MVRLAVAADEALDAAWEDAELALEEAELAAADNELAAEEALLVMLDSRELSMLLSVAVASALAREVAWTL